MPSVNFPTALMPTSTGAGVVSLGLVYIGEPDEDPSILANRIDVTVIDIDGTPVVIGGASQPFILNAGGLFSYNGSVVQLRVSQNYSMSIYSATNVLLYYFPSAAAGEVLLTTVVQLTATTDPDPIAGTGQLYAKSISGLVEFFYMDSAGNIVQFTEGGNIKVDLSTSAIAAFSLSAIGKVYGGYFLGGVVELVSSGNEVELDWAAAQYFTMVNTETTTMNFTNVPLIGEGIGQTILIAIQDAGDFAITLSPEAGYTVYVRAIDNPPALTVGGLDLIILTVYAEGVIVAVPLYNFEVIT